MQQPGLSFGTRLKIDSIIKLDENYKPLLEGASQAAEILAANGHKDVYALKWIKPQTQIEPGLYDSHPEAHDSCLSAGLSPFISMSRSGIAGFFRSFDQVSEWAENNVFKKADTAKNWILKAYKDLNPIN